MIVDNEGRYRVRIGKVHTQALTYFSVERDAMFEERNAGSRFVVTDGETILRASKPILSFGYDPAYPERLRATRDSLEAWCDQNYPRWRDPSAYWSD